MTDDTLLTIRFSPDKILPFSRVMSLNTGTLFEAAGTAEVIGHYTGARSPARTFCDSAAAAPAAAAATPAAGQSKCLNRRGESEASRGRMLGASSRGCGVARARARRSGGRNSRRCLILSRQALAIQAVFVSAGKSGRARRKQAPQPEMSVHSRDGDVFAGL